MTEFPRLGQGAPQTQDTQRAETQVLSRQKRARVEGQWLPGRSLCSTSKHSAQIREVCGLEPKHRM